MEQYLANRRALIVKDRAARLDVAHSDIFDDEADAFVCRVRAEEAVSIWGPESTHTHGEGDVTHLFPGMAFLTARDIIVKTRLFKIMSKMPKGALLHAHLDATVNARVLLDLALKYPAFHIMAEQSLTALNLNSIRPKFRPLPRSVWTEHCSLTESYEVGAWVPLHKARENFTFGGPEGFDRWVISALTISPAEAYRTHNTTVKIWDKFTSTFRMASGLIHYLPLWKEYVRAFLLSSVEDGISYIEVRVNFWYRFIINEEGEEVVSHHDWLAAFDRIVHDVQAELAAQGRADELIGCKIIYSTIRNETPEDLEWYLEDCLALKQAFPHLLAGFDLVGHEDLLRPLIDYLVPLQRFVARQRELGLDIPFIFHAGETLGDGTAADMNLYDALLLGTKRIGHGFSLIKHPELMKICRERDVAIEVCPISNEILRLTSSMPAHPLAAVMNHGVPVTLCSDDPSVFGNMGLSYDFFQVLVASELNSLKTMGCLARDSFKYCCLTDDEKDRATALWDKQWRKFNDWLVQEQHRTLNN